jgi:hypothetical protein
MKISPDARRTFDEWYRSLPRSEHLKRLDTYAHSHRFMPLMAFNGGETVITQSVMDLVIEIMCRFR